MKNLSIKLKFHISLELLGTTFERTYILLLPMAKNV